MEWDLAQATFCPEVQKQALPDLFATVGLMYQMHGGIGRVSCDRA